MHVVMYSIQSSFCTNCPLPSGSDIDLICTGLYSAARISLCPRGANVSELERGWKGRSRVLWKVSGGEICHFKQPVQEWTVLRDSFLAHDTLIKL